MIQKPKDLPSIPLDEKQVKDIEKNQQERSIKVHIEITKERLRKESEAAQVKQANQSYPTHLLQTFVGRLAGVVLLPTLLLDLWVITAGGVEELARPFLVMVWAIPIYLLINSLSAALIAAFVLLELNRNRVILSHLIALASPEAALNLEMRRSKLSFSFNLLSVLFWTFFFSFMICLCGWEPAFALFAGGLGRLCLGLLLAGMGIAGVSRLLWKQS